ncbi:MAG: trimethylamine methyltransferase family protein [bacterium]
MARVNYTLTGGLTREQILRVHEAALDIIQNVGIYVPHDGIRKLLGEHRGVAIDGEVVRFAPYLVEESIKAQSYPEEFANPEDFIVISGAYELNVTDLDTGEIRPATMRDLRDLVKLADSYGMYGSAPVRPTDIPPALQEIAMYKVSWENSPRRASSVFEAIEKSTPEAAEYIYEMSQVAGKRFSLGIWIASPFRVPYDLLEIIYRFLDRKVPMWAAAMPIAGATAPIHLPGAYVQSIAELLAGVTMLRLVSRGAPVHSLIIDSIRAYPFDMRYGSFVYGSPEDLLATLIQIQLNEFYGIPVVAKSLLTTSQEPDGHAAAEKAAHTIVAALAGARIFTNAGLLSVDEIYSAEQVVIDNEIVEYVKRVVRGFEFDEEHLAVDAIKGVGLGGEFLSHESTLRNYREAFWMPELFEHRMLAQWREAGSKSLRERARAIAKRRIAEHEYRLDPAVQRELDRIYKKAADRFL